MIKVVLFGNTGLANGVFRALIANASIELCGVYTRKLPGHFPYYKEDELWYLCEQMNIPVFIGENVNSERSIANLTNLKPDYIIVSSFDQIVKKQVIDIPKYGIINFHPSLLPKYRGPNPISWVLINGEKVTGLTIHRLVRGIDSGNVLYQEQLEVDKQDNLGSLYNKLSVLAGSMSVKLIKDLTSNGLAIGAPQDETQTSYYAKSTSFRYVDLNDDNVENILNRIRAFSPFPKPFLLLDGVNYLVEDVIVSDEIISESYYSKDREIFHLAKPDVTLKFRISLAI